MGKDVHPRTLNYILKQASLEKGDFKLMPYLVFFEQGDTNYSAYVPDLPVCVAVGDTLEETRKEISEAMKFHIECLHEDGEVVPMPTSKLPNQTPSGVSAEFVTVGIKGITEKGKSAAAQRLITAMEKPPHLTDKDIEALNRSIREGKYL